MEKFDDWGRRDPDTRRRRGQERKNPLAEYIFSIVINGALLFAAHRLPDWQFSKPWLLEDAYRSMLWTLDLSFITQITGNFMLIFYRPKYMRRLVSLMFNTVSIVFLSNFINIFPVDVYPYGGVPVNLIIRIAAIAGLVGTGIAAAVNLIRLIVSSIRSGFAEEDALDDSGGRDPDGLDKGEGKNG